MLRKAELEELVKRRRNVQDLDLEWYLRIKGEVLALLLEVKSGNLEQLTLEKIDKLQKDVELAKMKTELGLDLELAKYNITSAEVEKYDSNIRRTLTEHIISSSKEFKNLDKKIELTKELLENRNRLNKTIQDYFTKTKIIKLTRTELNTLFDKDTNDLKLILSSGRLIHEDRTDPTKDEFEFTFSKSSSFRLSSQDLEKQIKAQIEECDDISKHIEQSKNQWKTATTKLIGLLDTIEKNIQV